MIRRLKTLLLASMAIAAIGAAAASAAQASTVFENLGGASTDLTMTPDGNTTTAHQVFSFVGQSMTCRKFEGHTTISAATATNIVMREIGYSECTFLGQPATVKMNGCNYNLSAEGTIKIECTGTNKIEFEGAGCKVEINAGQDFANGSVTYHNIGTPTAMEVTVSTGPIGGSGGVNGIEGTATGAGCLTAGAFTTGEYTTGNVIITGEAPVTKARKNVTVS